MALGKVTFNNPLKRIFASAVWAPREELQLQLYLQLSALLFGPQGRNSSTRKPTMFPLNWKLRFPLEYLGFLCPWTNGKTTVLLY